jgi:glycosyltransferase involved in cell wall biosynthesis
VNKLLTVLILTRDEEENLPETLRSLAPLGARVLVVDSGSTDRTAAIAREAGAEVVEHAFINQAAQINWALDNGLCATPWIMRLDADERVTPELATELRATIPALDEGVTGLEVKRRVYFWGRWIKHGGYYPTWLFRVWRAGTARSEQRSMDEHLVSMKGRLVRLHHDIIDENRKGLSHWVNKHNQYSTREVLALEREGGQPSSPGGQAGRRRWFKTNVYGRTPLFLRAVLYWTLRYFLLLGFLDGLPGLVFHFNQALWYRLLVDAKIYESRMATGRQGDLDATGS